MATSADTPNTAPIGTSRANVSTGPSHARRVAVPAITVAVLLVVWEAVVRLGIVPNFLLPSPTQVVAALVGDSSLLAAHAGTTLVESALGLVIGVVVGFVAAVLMDRFETIYLALDPLITISQTIPTVAIAAPTRPRTERTVQTRCPSRGTCRSCARWT